METANNDNKKRKYHNRNNSSVTAAASSSKRVYGGLEELGNLKNKPAILVVAIRGKERTGAREAISMLQDESNRDADDDGKSSKNAISKQLSLEINKVRDDQNEEPIWMETGIDCLVMIHNVESPCDAVFSMFERLLKQGHQSSRFVEKIIPLSRVCHSSLDVIVSQTKQLLAERISNGQELPKSFAIVPRLRSAGPLDRTELIDACASLVDQTKCKVNLTQPDMVIIIEALKNIAGITIMDGALFRKYSRLSVRNLFASVPNVGE